ncbi:cytochrome P450 family protein [Nonomuraea dietziae]|uniref:Cytochrome P450 n=1 Tax=Nonomuraea dietziae TaxID=65515 RepID=A0A7W5VF94_9ACTN|nr:cytochrome P450 [Nonomuraea dietziae]MBB3733811.1 cytochrome P450 [Nonomuraea dietziae]
MTPHDRPIPTSEHTPEAGHRSGCPHLADAAGEAPVDRVPVITLDPTGADHHGEAARLRAAGPVVRVLLPGGIPAWAITRHSLLLSLLNDVRISKDWHTWTCVQRGDIGEDWPLTGMLKVTNMVTADGDEHHRLRRLVTRTLTPRRIHELRPRIAALITDVVDELPDHADADGVVDLRRHFAYPIPMRVVCELVGVPDADRPRLRHLVESIFRSTTEPGEVLQTQHDIYQVLGQVIRLRHEQPGPDLTSALIAARRDDPDALTEEELVGTLWLMIAAGHETTLSLLLNAVRALLTHPGQLTTACQRALADPAQTWAGIVEEVLRWDAPIGNFMARYPRTDITIAGVTIPAGDAILAPYSLLGRDPDQHGPDADRFDIGRAQRRHLAFGGGPHVCPGAGLARLEAALALPALFDRYPRMALAVPAADLIPVPSLFSNSVQALPVVLTPVT